MRFFTQFILLFFQQLTLLNYQVQLNVRIEYS